MLAFCLMHASKLLRYLKPSGAETVVANYCCQIPAKKNRMIYKGETVAVNATRLAEQLILKLGENMGSPTITN